MELAGTSRGFTGYVGRQDPGFWSDSLWDREMCCRSRGVAVFLDGDIEILSVLNGYGMTFDAGDDGGFVRGRLFLCMF